MLKPEKQVHFIPTSSFESNIGDRMEGSSLLAKLAHCKQSLQNPLQKFKVYKANNRQKQHRGTLESDSLGNEQTSG